MGNGQSRHRPRPPQAMDPYPPPPFHQGAQAPHFYPQEPVYLNNGQYYGGWRPPYHPPFPPQMGPYLPGRGMGPPPPPTCPAPPQRRPSHAPTLVQDMSQTETIRNPVNLKKATLQLVPVGGDPQRLGVQFAFDASAPCYVTTFVMATEEPSRGCQLTPASPPAPPGVVYSKGLGLRFPKPGSEGGQAVIDLQQLDEAKLSAPDGDTYPLVIRLETITEAGLAEGHTLQELTPGGQQKIWIQSQTTFAAVVKDAEGRHHVRVLKQKIWVKGNSYELQEIFGMDTSSQASTARSAEKEGLSQAEEAEERLCVICLVNDRDTTVLPCRHMCMCHECGQELRKQTSKCPICRNEVEALLHIKIQRGGQKASPAAEAHKESG